MSETEYDANHGYGPEDFDDEYGEYGEYGEWVTCQKCGGSGISSDCIDDLCNGQECIHGDDSTCSACGGEGEVDLPPLPKEAPRG